MNSSNFNKFRVLLSVMPLNCLLQVRLNLLDIPLTDVYSWNTGTAIFSPNMNSFINFLFFTWCLLMASYLFSNIRIWHNWSVCVCVCVCVCEVTLVVSYSLWLWFRQVLLSMGFPRQEYWSGLPFPFPGGYPSRGIEPSSLVSPVSGCGGGLYHQLIHVES